MNKKFLLWSIILLSGCSSVNNPVKQELTPINISDAYKEISEIKDYKSRLFLNYAKEIKTKYPEMKTSTYGRPMSIRFNPVSSDYYYEHTNDKKWLNFYLSQSFDEKIWRDLYVYSKHSGNYKASKEEAIKYCKEITSLISPSFSIVIDKLSRDLEVKEKNGSVRVLSTFSGRFNILLNGEEFDEGGPFICNITQFEDS